MGRYFSLLFSAEFQVEPPVCDKFSKQFLSCEQNLVEVPSLLHLRLVVGGGRRCAVYRSFDQ